MHDFDRHGLGSKPICAILLGTVMYLRQQITRPKPNNFSKTKTEIEAGKFGDLKLETETKNNRYQDKTATFLQKSSPIQLFKKQQF